MSYEKEIPVYGSAQSVTIVNAGYNYDWLQNLFLSSYSVGFPSLTSVDRHTNIRRVSAICPAFEGYLLPISSYEIVNKNTLRLNLSTINFIDSGYIDVIFENVAGYTKLSDINNILVYSAGEEVIITPTPSPDPGEVTFILLPNDDTDGDGYTDNDETVAGTDINDPTDFPISLFNTFNNI